METSFCCEANFANDPFQRSDFITKTNNSGKKEKGQANILQFFWETKDIKLK